MKKNTIAVDGIDLCYFEKGKGETVLFIHGLSMDKTFFSSQLESSLADKYRMIALDLPGHGESGHVSSDAKDADSYSIGFYVKYIIKFIEQLEINPIIVGLSLGAHVVTQVANLVQTKGLVLVQNTPAENTADLATAFHPVASMMSLYKENLEDEEMSQLFADMYLKPEIPSLVKEAFEKCDPTVRPVIAQGLMNPVEMGELTILKGLAYDFAIFQSKRDLFINLDYLNGLKLDNLYNGAPVILQGVGHYPMLTDVDDFNNELEKYLSTLS